MTTLAAVGFVALLVIRKCRMKNSDDPTANPQLEPRDDPENTNV